MFSQRLETAEAYAAFLADAGTVRGLIGPREVARLWDRHLLNCAVLADLIPEGASVCDLGSGAGLPGLVLAIRRPDLRVTLVEPLLRRTSFLEEAVALLGLDNVEVLRARAEQVHGTREFDVVTSRAVAALDKLLGWSLPLCRPGGQVLAMKGASAQDEVDRASAALQRLGASSAEVVQVGVDVLDIPTTVVRVEAGSSRRVGLSPARSGSPSKGARGRKQRRN